MADKNITVDEFVKARVLPEFRSVVAALREIMRECAPDAEEAIRYGIPAYKGKRIFAVISPAKTYITLSFSRGSDFEDKHGLLGGVGKVSRNLRFKRLKDVDETVLRYYIQQALKHDRK
ncbi:Uncharacterised protein [uncultured archaeon]|nr:Uncharacterised protein [uncultured archaeon]